MNAFRLVFASLLSSMIFIGHAPAWLHSAGCSHNSGMTLVAENSSDFCTHGCLHHEVADSPSRDSSTDESRLPADHQHDSETCALCQSLVAPTGLQWQSEVVVADELGVFELPGADPLRPFSAQILIPQPRGPPVFLVS